MMMKCDQFQLRLAVTISLYLSICLAVTAVAQESADGAPHYSDQVKRYLGRIYDASRRKHSFQGESQQEFVQWQQAARPALAELIGLNEIRNQVGDFQPQIELGNVKDLGTFTRTKGWIETEPDVRIPFWLLKSKGAGPFPLAVLPHGHDTVGHDTHAGVFHDEKHRQRTVDREGDVAVQAVQHGFVAVAPAMRGLAVDGAPDVFQRHGKSDCRSQLMHCLLAGRTAIGERVWDLQRILDWAVTLPEVDPTQVLMMGNSGGGMATLYTAALDERVTIAVPSCSFTTATSPEGRIYHCDCNIVPGLFGWGDLYDVAGLIAPRYLLAVNGRQDSLHEAAAIEEAASKASAIYQAAGYPERFQHAWGSEGHRYYSQLMWPFVMNAMQ